MNKAELAVAVAEQVHGTESDARAHIDALFDVIMRSVAAGERVQVVGFGTFDGAQRASRVGRNPRTGAAIQIAASVTPRFQAGQTFRARVNGASPSSATPVAEVAEAVEAAEPAPVVTKKADGVAKKAKAKKAKPALEKKAAKATKPAAKKAKAAKPAAKKVTAKSAKTAKATKATAKSAKQAKSGKK